MAVQTNNSPACQCDTTAMTLPQEEIARALVQVAVKKHNDRYENVFMKAFLAGCMLSFGGLLSQFISAGSAGLTKSDPGIAKVLSGIVFPVGLVMIFLQGQELLTSNMMTFPMACMTRAVPLWGLAVNWIIVFFGNLVGSLFFAALLVRYSGVASAAPYHDVIRDFAIHKAGDPQWHQIFLRGIGCNWLVSVAIWQATGAKDTISRILSIWIPVWIFVACGFDHVIANMFSVPLGIMFGAGLTPAAYIRKSLIAALIGNIVGALFVALPGVYMFLREKDGDDLGKLENGTSGSSPTSSKTQIRDAYVTVA